jgi:type IV pilus assembly protein PilM
MGTVKFYKDEPLFGLDIGHANLKALQAEKNPDGSARISGYGISDFDSSAIQNGVIIKPDVIAQAMHELFEKNLTGTITSRRVACSLPTSRTFSRPMKIPVMDHEAILEAVHLEAEQYIPIPISNLYLDYEVTRQDEKEMEILLVAASKNIVDSYHKTLEALQLEPVAFEPSINAASRLVQLQGISSQEPAIIVDIGSITSDIAVYDKTLLVSTAVGIGGDNMTELISKDLHLTRQQAAELKDEYGISYSDKQQRIVDAIKPALESLVHEIQKSIRYYSERAAKSDRKITQVVTVGGGSVMPGLNQHLSLELRLPTQSLDPWQKMTFGQLPIPSDTDRAMFITAAGEALVDPNEALV